MGAPELKARRDSVYGKIAGVTKTPEMIVSDQLIITCVGVVDKNRCAYVPWEQCTSRTFDVTGQKTDDAWMKVGGYMKCESRDPDEPAAETGTEHHLNMLLMRRGIAFEMSDMMSWESHERLREDYMKALMKPAVPGYAKVTRSQVRRADECAFELMAEFTEGGIQKVGGVRPLDAAVSFAMTHRDYNQILQQMVASSARSSAEQFGDAGQGARRQDVGLSRAAERKQARKRAEQQT